jgi:transcriptional regulator GlxA family with amidase domain
MLVAGISQGLTVTDIALACGFTHLSKFARDYFERYNERPSTTLRGARFITADQVDDAISGI